MVMQESKPTSAPRVLPERPLEWQSHSAMSATRTARVAGKSWGKRLRRLCEDKRAPGVSRPGPAPGDGPDIAEIA